MKKTLLNGGGKPFIREMFYNGGAMCPVGTSTRCRIKRNKTKLDA